MEEYNVLLGINNKNKNNNLMKKPKKDIFNNIKLKNKKLKIIQTKKLRNVIQPIEELYKDVNNNINNNDEEYDEKNYEKILNDYKVKKKELLNNAQKLDSNFLSNPIFKAGYGMSDDFWESEKKDYEEKIKLLNNEIKNNKNSKNNEDIKKQIENLNKIIEKGNLEKIEYMKKLEEKDLLHQIEKMTKNQLIEEIKKFNKNLKNLSIKNKPELIKILKGFKNKILKK